MAQLTAAITLLSAVGATGASKAIAPDGNQTAFQITGTFVATVDIEASLDGTLWTVLSSKTAPALVSDSGNYKFYRANVSAFTSGTITVKALF